MSTGFPIKNFEGKDVNKINKMFPSSWNFDFNEFIDLYFKKEFFKGFTIYHGELAVGFGNLIVFNQTAWLGNIVVDKDYRNRGLGTKITKELIRQGETVGVKTFFLIATDTGVPIYKNLGFRIDQKYGFYKPIKIVNETENISQILTAERMDYQEIYRFDLELTGESRKELLQQFIPKTKIIRDKSGKLSGFYIKDLGNGLILADNHKSGIELLKLKIQDNGQQIVLPLANEPVVEFLEKYGYKMTISVPRMILGDKINWRSDAVFSRSSGYIG